MVVNDTEGGWPPIVAIVGPTAVGKSRLALELAATFGAEIVSADSRMVYRYMDVGTDKPSLLERARITHHLVDVVSPDETYTAGRYQEDASRVLRRLAALGRRALVVGGTGFYLRALLDRPHYPAVPPDPALRHRLRALEAEWGDGALHRLLADRDPVAARRIHPHNIPRLIRALEIVEATHAPIPAGASGNPLPALWLGLTMDRDRLRIVSDRRVLWQVEHGLVDESKALLAMGFDPDLPALSGFGYRQMIAHLQGRLSLPAAVDEYQAATHRYIRRQLTWFRQDTRIHWLTAGAGAVTEASTLVERWLSNSRPVLSGLPFPRSDR